MSMIRTAPTHGGRLRIIREDIGFSREDFAELLGTSVRRLRSLEADERGLSASDFETVGRLFPFALDFLVYGGEWRQWDPDTLRQLVEHTRAKIAADKGGKNGGQ